jgi:TonB family protein
MLFRVLSISIVLNVCSCYVLNAQQAKIFLNEKFEYCDSAQATYLRIVKPETDSTLIMEDFQISGALYRKADIYCKRYGRKQHFDKDMITNDQLKQVIKNTNIIFHGEVKQYYLNGKPESVGLYINDRKQGIFNCWYFNGNKKGQFVYDDSLKIDHDFKVLNFYDSLGKQWVSNSNGIFFEYENKVIADSGKIENGLKEGEWRGTLWEGKLSFSEQFREGKLQQGMSTDPAGKTYGYDKNLVNAEYKNGGLNGLYHFLSVNLKYPSSARRMGIDGVVYIEFVIDKYGNLIDIKLIKGLSSDLDAEAMRVVRAIGSNFNPSLFKGQRVNNKYVLPIRFKLEV